MSGPAREVSPSGVLASLGASVLFGFTFLLPPRLLPLDPGQILAYRIVVTLAVLVPLFTALRVWPEVLAILRRCREAPHLAVVLVVDAALLGLQLWLFGWAPQSGHGLELSLGYLVLPLVMVLTGAVVYRERLSALRVTAVATASVGVVAAVVLAGGLSWPTLLVALGLPLYFVSRRAFALDSTGAQFLELTAMLPFSVVVMTVHPSFGTVTAEPGLVAGLLVLGLVSAGGFTLYLTASRVLPFALFGVLSYVEPVLLVLVALTVLGEPWTATDSFVYLPICAGLCVLAVEVHREGRRRADAVLAR